jgi:YD repeat-containing protein
VTDALGRVSTTVYDALNRTVAAVDALGKVASTVYDAAGRTQATIDQAGFISTTVYDGAGRAIASVDPIGNRTSMGYDSAGRIVATTNALGYTWTTLLDAAGRAIASIDPLGNRTSSSYDFASQLVQMTDANGVPTTSVYDLAGRVAASVDGNGNRTSSVYDAAGRRIAVIDPRGNATTQTFDALGRSVGTLDPLGNRQTYAFDSVGNQTLRIDGRGYSTTYQYDSLNRMTSRLYPDGSVNTLSWDAVGNRTAAQDSVGSYTTTYDSLNRPATVKYPAGWTTSYAYDARGFHATTDVPSAGRVSYNYDPAGRIAWLVNPYGERSTFLHDAAGRRIANNLANGVSTSFLYDASNRLTWQINASPTGATLSSFNYRMDKVGNRLGVVEAGGDVVSWSYDSAYQLTNEQRTGTLAYDTTYTYDPAGNRLTQNDGVSLNTYTYDAANQQTNWAAPTFLITNTYDQNGNMTTGLSTYPSTYTWDYENRVTVANRLGGVSGPQLISTHVYDPGYRRVRGTASNNGVVTDQKYVWDGENIDLYTDGNDTALGVFTYVPEAYGSLVSQRYQGASSYHLFDALASVRQLANAAGAVTDSYNYKAFGASIGGSGSTANLWTFGGRVGYIYDSASGDYLARRRWLAPTTGIWTNRLTPFGFFAYCQQNPIGMTAPGGVVGIAEDPMPPRFTKNVITTPILAGLCENTIDFNHKITAMPDLSKPPYGKGDPKEVVVLQKMCMWSIYFNCMVCPPTFTLPTVLGCCWIELFQGKFIAPGVLEDNLGGLYIRGLRGAGGSGTCTSRYCGVFYWGVEVRLYYWSTISKDWADAEKKKLVSSTGKCFFHEGHGESPGIYGEEPPWWKSKRGQALSTVSAWVAGSYECCSKGSECAAWGPPEDPIWQKCTVPVSPVQRAIAADKGRCCCPL